MAPILIDRRDLKYAGLIALLVLLITFSAGFYLGYHQSAIFGGMAIEAEKMISASEHDAGLDSAAGDQVTEVVSYDNSTDAEQPEPVNVAEPVADIKAAPSHEEEKVAILAVEKSLAEAENLTTESPAPESSESADEINYSIQVAVYAGLSNAEKMMKKLQDKGLDAYVSDYISSSNKRRFNVRFGYFKDRKTAMAALNGYIKRHKGDGYLVNFSADNIVNFSPEERDENIGTSELSESPIPAEQATTPATVDVVDGTVTPPM